MDGNRLRDELVVDLKGRIEALGDPHLCLATVLVGDDKPSQIYVRNKRKKAEEAGMVSRHVELPGDISQPDLEAAVRDLADDPAVHGILVQLPLPPHIDEAAVINAVDVAKDVDGKFGRIAGPRTENGYLPVTLFDVHKQREKHGIPEDAAGARAMGVSVNELRALGFVAVKPHHLEVAAPQPLPRPRPPPKFSYVYGPPGAVAIRNEEQK